MTDHFVRPDVRQLLEFLDNLPGPKSHEVGPEGARQMMVAGRYALDAPAREIAVMRDVAGPVPLRLYDAREERAPGPVLVFIHGGGWVIGGLETHDPLCIDLAIELDLPVVAVDYRLAPEFPFPAAFDDSLAAARWIADGPDRAGAQSDEPVPRRRQRGRQSRRRGQRRAARRAGRGAGRRPVADLSCRRPVRPLSELRRVLRGLPADQGEHGLVRGELCRAEGATGATARC